MSTRSGPGWMLAAWLSTRPPARLAVDGFVILLISAVLAQVQYALGPFNPTPPSDTMAGRFVYLYQPAALFSVLVSGLVTLGWITVAVACARFMSRPPEKAS